MSDAIMTTEMVQECVENDAAEAYKELLIESHPYGEVRITEAALDEARAIGAKEFKLWLAERDREVKAQAWEQGAQAVSDVECGYIGLDGYNNPYKEQA